MGRNRIAINLKVENTYLQLHNKEQPCPLTGYSHIENVPLCGQQHPFFMEQRSYMCEDVDKQRMKTRKEDTPNALFQKEHGLKY
jgi:hypothetical protein